MKMDEGRIMELEKLKCQVEEAKEKKTPDLKRGHSIPESVRQKISETLKGHRHSEERKLKIKQGVQKWNNEKRDMQKKKELGESMDMPEVLSKVVEEGGGMKMEEEKIVSAETREKMAQANRGKKLSAETREKMAEAKQGKKLSAETREKMAEAKQGKKRSEETREKLVQANRGKKLSEETREKMAEAKRGKKLSEETRRKIRDGVNTAATDRFLGRIPESDIQLLVDAQRSIGDAQRSIDYIVSRVCDNI